MAPIRFAAALLLALSFAGGWTGGAAAQDDSIDGVTPETEARESARAHASIVAQSGGGYSDPRLVNYVTMIGERLRVAAGPAAAPFQFTFTFLDSPGAVAFAQPGGYIYLSRGLLALASSESEIAAVMAHEMGHVILRHGAYRQRLQKAMAGQAPGAIAGATNRLSRAQELEADATGIGTARRGLSDLPKQNRAPGTARGAVEFGGLFQVCEVAGTRKHHQF